MSRSLGAASFTFFVKVRGSLWLRKYRAIRASSSALKHQFAFACIPRQRCRALKLRARLCKSTKSSEQIPAYARQEVIALKRSVREQSIDDLQACRWTKSHGNRYGAIQFHNGRRRQEMKCLVQRHDSRPVRIFRSTRAGVTCGDRGLQSVRSKSASELFCATERGEASMN